MALDCPRCHGVSLEEIEMEGVFIDRCVRCAGLWFDHDEVTQLVNVTPTIKQLDSVIPPATFAVASLECPRCRGVALREHRMFGGEEYQDSIVYRCASCSGSWMDRGQLRFVEDGNIAQSLREILSRVTGE